jgi:transcriptional regulator with XRE-family HTH domain
MTALNLKTHGSNQNAPKAKLKNLRSIALLRLVRNALPVSQEQVARLLKVSSRTVARWEKSDSGPERQEQKERLVRLQQIIDLGAKVYTPEGLSDFFSTPLPEFGNKTAYDMFFIGDYDAVLSALAADYEGLGG